MGTPRAPESVDFHFDLMCPWAYQASIWIREVRDLAGVAVTWRFFSLEEINRAEGRKHPWERPWSYGWSMMRIGAHLRREDPALLDAWYHAAGSALHVQGRKPHTPEGARSVLAEMGLDPAVADAAIADPTTHDDVKADHDRVVALGGWGVPTLVFDGDRCLFGPVVVDPPAGEAAVGLWEHVCAWLSLPTLYEIQRPKSGADLALVAERFHPYFSARDWVTVQKETP